MAMSLRNVGCIWNQLDLTDNKAMTNVGFPSTDKAASHCGAPFTKDELEHSPRPTQHKPNIKWNVSILRMPQQLNMKQHLNRADIISATRCLQYKIFSELDEKQQETNDSTIHNMCLNTRTMRQAEQTGTTGIAK